MKTSSRLLIKMCLFLILTGYSLLINSLSAWSEPVSIAANGINQYVSAGIDSNGNAIAIWVNGKTQFSSIQSSFFNGKVWSDPINLTDLGVYSNPKIELNSSGNAIAAWEYYDGSNCIIQSASTKIGEKWSNITTISSLGINGSPDLVIDDAGNAIAIWSKPAQDEIYVAIKPSSNPWKKPQVLSKAIGVTRPQIEMNSQGIAIAMWYNDAEKTSSISTYSESNWSNPMPIEQSATQRYDEGGIAINKSGFCIALWSNMSTGQLWGVATNQFDNWSQPPVIISTEESNSNPQVSLADDNNAVAVWIDFIQNDVKSSSFFNGTWNSPTTISNTFGNQDVQVIIDQIGRVTAIWQSWDGGKILTNSMILGSSNWSVVPLQISNDDYYNSDVKLIANSSGNIIAFWIAKKDSNTQIYTSTNY